MKKFKSHTLKEYLNVLSKKDPVPGGGSAAALNGALGVSLIGMVANYSKGKNSSKVVEKRIQKILNESQGLQKQFLELVDLDAEAYLKVVKARKGTEKQKKTAAKAAAAVPSEVCRLCYKSIQLTTYLVEKGSPYLLNDLEIATEMLFCTFNSARTLLKES